MLKRHIAVALATLALGSAGAASAAELGADPHQFDGARKMIEFQRQITNIPGVAVAVAQGGKIVWEEGFGYADKEKKIPATADTIFSLASITKPITAAGLMVLVQQGKIDLDRPINDYLGAAKLVAHVGDAKDATVRRVANHTAGLPLHYQFFYEDDASAVRPPMDESIRRYGHLMTAPGERMEYSNFGYGVLDYVIARTSKKSYADFIRDEVYLPLGMTSSSINKTPDFGDRVAKRYAPNGTPVPFYDFDHQGASAAFTSAHDLVRFGMFFLGDEVEGQKPILTEANLKEMLRPTAVDQSDGSSRAVAWGIETVNGIKTINHNGGMAGVSTSLYLIPDMDVVVVILANSTVQTSALVPPIVMSLMPNANRAKVYAPETGVLGAWRGSVKTPDGVVPVTLDIANGAAMMKVGSGPAQNVNAQMDDEGMLQIQDVVADVGAKDAAHYPYKLTFKLKPRGKVLNGSVAAMSDRQEARLGNALSYWVELQRP